jgi:O-antigen/teichoic acid export membrane protein
LARNTLLNLSGQLLPLAAAVFCIPLIVHGLGAARFGILSLVWIVSSYASIFDLGLGRATTKRVAEALGQGDTSSIPHVAWTAALVQTLMGTIGGLVLALSASTLAQRTLNIPPALVAEAVHSFHILAFAIPAVLVLSSFRGVLEAGQRFGLVNAVKVPLATATFVVPAIGVLLDRTLATIVAALVVTLYLGAYAYYRASVMVFPSIRTQRHFHRGEFGHLLRFGSWVTVSSVIVPVLVYSDRLLLGALASVAAVGLYAAPFDMIMRASVIAASLAATLFPAFSSLRARGRADTYERIAGQSVKFLLLAVGPIAMITIPLAPAILTVWLGPVYANEAAAALRILSLGVLVNCLAYVPSALIQAFDRPDITAKLHLVELPLYLLLAWVLIGKFGIVGAAVAWSARILVDAGCLFWLAHKLFRVSLHPLLNARIVTAVAMLLVGGTCLAMLGPAHIPPRVQLLGGVIMLGMVAAGFWTLALEAPERQRLLGLIPHFGQKPSSRDGTPN